MRAVRAAGLDWQQLDYLLRNRASPTARFVPLESELAKILKQLRSDLLAVEAPSEAEKQELLRNAVVNYLSNTLGVSAELTSVLLANVTHEAAPALQRFLELAALQAETPSLNTARPQFETLEQLLKLASITQTLQLTRQELEWLLHENRWLSTAEPPTSSVPLASWRSLMQIQQLCQELQVEDAAVESIRTAIASVHTAADSQRVAARQAFVDTLARWFGWPAEDVESLLGGPSDPDDLGLLKARLPEDYRIDLVVRLHLSLIHI